MTNSMTRAEKLRFLADRMEDEKEFYIGYWLFKYQNGVLMELCESNSSFMNSVLLIDTVIKYDLKLKPQWEFTEDEKNILRNIPRKFNWIARDYDGKLSIHLSEPTSLFGAYYVGRDSEYLRLFDHLFKTIRPQECVEFKNQLKR